MTRLSICVAVALVGWSVAPGLSGQKTAREVDDEFLKKAAAGNQAEIEFSKLAGRRSESESVKEFANRLIKDHQMVFEKMAELLKTRKIAIVAGTEKDTKDEAQRLAKLQGASFDRAFLKRMVDDHNQAITLYEGQVNAGKAADITAFAKEMLPGLREHLRRAETLAKEIK